MFYATDGSVYSTLFEQDGPLVQVQACYYEGGPNPLYQMKLLMEKYGQNHVNSEGSSPPSTIEEFKVQYQTQWTYTSKKIVDADKKGDNVNFQKNRSGYYLTLKNLKELLMYLDDILAWREKYQKSQKNQNESQSKLMN